MSAAGDVNGDGNDDLLIGAPQRNSNTGRSYIVFGGSNVGVSGTIALSSLNGSNGFKLDGEETSDSSGIALSAVGDMNQDGFADFMIGAVGYSNSGYQAGRSYVIFGGVNVGGSGLLQLSSINGLNGFKFDGIAYDFNGYSLTQGVDLNNDGYLDLVFSAPNHIVNGISFTGCVYILFGAFNSSINPLISASNLNDLNGFTLNAEMAGSQTGRWVNAVDDVNGDGYADLLIGAPLYNNHMSRSYVVFGNSELGSNGSLPLSMLNGANGFKLTGEMVGDNGGIVYGPGDINGDGYDDLLIGANYHNNNTGRSYLVFGKPTVGSSGEILLSGLNGTNGFKIDGESPGDYSGFSSTSSGPIGDINADGYVDIPISAFGHNNNAGRSYILFGNSQIGNSAQLSLLNLDGTNGFKIDGENPGDMSGLFSVTGVGDINGDSIRYGDRCKQLQ